MSTVTVPRSNVTVAEVSAVLRDNLSARYRITPGMATGPNDNSTIQVKANWLERANVRIRPGADSTEIHVSPGVTLTLGGMLFNRFGIARKVHHVLERSPELARSN
jgi:predicted RNase H-like nuclease (RuvC/YqgF family)